MGNIGSSPSFQTEEDRANMYDARTNEIWLPDRMRDGARRPLKEGDMIQFQRGKYEHWAVYVGHGNVIQRFGPDGMIMSLSSFSSPQMTATFNGGIVKETTFRDVIQDSTARINNFKDKEWVVLSADEIVAHARACIGKKGYHVLFNNCENFATECRYGTPFSGQGAATFGGDTIYKFAKAVHNLLPL